MSQADIKRAKLRVKEQEARVAAYDAETDQQKAREAIARKKLERAHQPASYRASDGTTFSLTDMSRVKPGYIAKEIDPRDLPAAIEAGTIKVETDGSVQRSAKTVAKSLRVMNAADTRTLRRLEATIAKALEAKRILTIEAWERGIELSVAEVAKHAANIRALYEAIPFGGYGRRGGPDDWRRRGIESDVADAQIHLRFVSGEMDAEQTECPCLVCKHDRAEAQRAALEAAKIAALPKVSLAPCPLCGKNHRAPLGRVRSASMGDNVPGIYCAKGNDKGEHWHVHQSLLEKEQAQAKKAEEDDLRRNGVTWVCGKPGCHETVTAVPQVSDQDGELYVECPVCELSDYLTDIKPIGRNARKYAKEAA